MTAVAASPFSHSARPRRMSATRAASRMACPRTSRGAAAMPRRAESRTATASSGPGIRAPESPMMNDETKIAAGVAKFIIEFIAQNGWQNQEAGMEAGVEAGGPAATVDVIIEIGERI